MAQGTCSAPVAGDRNFSSEQIAVLETTGTNSARNRVVNIGTSGRSEETVGCAIEE